MFTKRCIVPAAGLVPTYLSGLAAQSAVYAPLDFQLAAANEGGAFRTISRTAAIGFGLSFTRAPAHAQFENGVVNAARAMADLFQQQGGAGIGNPYLRYTVGDNYYDHDKVEHVVAPAIVATPTNFDASFFGDMKRSLTGEAFIFDIPKTFFKKEAPIVRSELYGVDPASASKGVTMEEPFLGFHGMSVFRPSGIFPVLDRLPPFIQDSRYYIQSQKNQNMLVDPAVSQLHLTGVSENLIAHLVPVSDYTLTVRSDNGFNQREKELQKANIPYPYIRHFLGVPVVPTEMDDFGVVTKVVSIPPCECTTSKGAPDFIFIRLERVYNNNTRTAPFDPVIRTLKLNIRFQDVKTVSDLDEMQLYQLTRRNSNFRADAKGNYTKYGAVLLRRQDLGNFVEWDGDKNDPFTVTFEANSYDVYDTSEASSYTAAVKRVLRETPIRLVVTFIYKDFQFKGDYEDCAFDFRQESK